MDKIVIMRIVSIIILTLAIDFYAFLGLKLIAKSWFTKKKKTIYSLHWGILSAFIILSFIYILSIRNIKPEYVLFRKTFTLSGIYFTLYISKFIFCVFVFFQHLVRLMDVLASRIAKFSCPVHDYFYNKAILVKIGTITSIALFLGLIYGVFWGKYDYYVKKIIIENHKIPDSFNDFKIIHFSDAHLGSFPDTTEFSKAIELINLHNPDIIAFTGDMVNMEAAEALPFVSLLKKLNAKYGKYAVLGNHDMGDYRKWYSNKEKDANLDMLDSIYQTSGFTLLNNENVNLTKGNDSIAIIGVKNWGKPPFRQYGNLQEAQKGVSKYSFQILLSHDPSHWDAEVVPFTNINLTLSGHTHGMQMGVDSKILKWSPVSFLYPRWSGLYEFNNQFLYINKGVGFIGFPGRLGMWPEITLIVLKNC